MFEVPKAEKSWILTESPPISVSEGCEGRGPKMKEESSAGYQEASCGPEEEFEFISSALGNH